MTSIHVTFRDEESWSSIWTQADKEPRISALPASISSSVKERELDWGISKCTILLMHIGQAGMQVFHYQLCHRAAQVRPMLKDRSGSVQAPSAGWYGQGDAYRAGNQQRLVLRQVHPCLLPIHYWWGQPNDPPSHTAWRQLLSSLLKDVKRDLHI